MSKLNKDMPLTEQFSAVIEKMSEDKLDCRAQQNGFLGLIAIALGSIADDLAVLADKEGKNDKNKR